MPEIKRFFIPAISINLGALMEPLMNTTQCLSYLNFAIKRKTLLKLSQQGEFPAIISEHNSGGRKKFRYLFKRANVDSWLRRHENNCQGI